MEISREHPPFIIAEMSGNHNSSLERAMLIIEEAAKSGANAIKFQTYTADTITLDCKKKDFLIDDPHSLWHGKNLYDLYEEAHTPWEWHEPMFKRARELGLIPFSAPFDLTAVDFLEKLKPELYKIASFEITHLPLIEKVAKTGKPLILSTGLASEDDISLAINTARGAGATKIILLKCTSAYPANASDANLLTIPDMAQKFGVDIGLSDHTLGIGVAIAAVSYGAVVIEKHFTMNREDGGVDSQFSLNPSEFRLLRDETIRAWNARGKVTYGGADNEQNSKVFRQSIWPTKDIKAGEKFSMNNVKICRPGLSLEPKYHKDLLEKSASRDISFGTRVLVSDLK
ncbi:MAG: pseudaminic acid synthase [Rickettsiaceae bacterium]